MMKIEEVEKLLVRYYDGATTEAEDRELQQFFIHEVVPPHLLPEKELFLQIASSLQTEVPEGLEKRLNHCIDKWEAEEKTMQHRRLNLRLQWVGSIAASLLLLFGVGMYLSHTETPATPQDTCATPEEAYAQAQHALLILSTTLNKGVKQIENVERTTQKVQENVNQQLNRINAL